MPFLTVATLLAAQAAPAQLAHSAPWLGQTFTVELTGLPAGAAVGLVFGAAPAQVPTPFGQLELDLAGAVEIGTGVADSQGTLGFQFALPQSTALAEAQAHLQAYVVDPVAGSLALTEAAHLRLLGSRIYAGQSAFLPELPGFADRIGVYSSPSMAEVFEVAGPFVDEDAETFLSADASVAAVVSGGVLWRFDNFYGAAVDSLDLGSIRSAALEAGGAALLVYAAPTAVLPGEVLRVPLEVGAPAVPLGIGGEAGPAAFDTVAGHVYVPFLPSPAGAAQVRRFDLASAQILANYVVAPPSFSELEWVAIENGTLFAGSRQPDPFLGGACAVGWTDPVPSAPLTILNLGSNDSLELDLTVLSTGQLLFHAYDWDLLDPFSAQISAWLLNTTTPSPQNFVPVDLGTFPPDDLSHAVDLGVGVWIGDRCCDLAPNGDGFLRLFELDLFSSSLVELDPDGPLIGYTDQSYAAMTGTIDFAGLVLVMAPTCPIACGPSTAFRVRNVLTGVEELVPTEGWSTHWVDGISIP